MAANLDLYLDRGGDCETAACGEYASTSGVDSVEWIVVREPEPGDYEIRIVAANDFPDPVRAGIAWTAIAETDTPGLTVPRPTPRLTSVPGTHSRSNCR